MEPRLELNDVSFSYAGRPPVFEHLGLRVYPGQVVGLIGPNGAGKTTILDLAFGRLRPRSGRVRILSCDPYEMSPIERARQIAYLIQRQNTPKAATVFDIVLSGRRPYRSLGGFMKEDEDIARWAALRLGIDDWLGRKASCLSGGEYQRVLMARIVAQSTPLLLCDEPSSSLDPKYLLSTFSLLKSLAREDSVAILVSVHDLMMASAFCDRIVLLAKGSVLFDGIPGELSDELLSDAYEMKIHRILTARGSFFAYGDGMGM
ncbi:MAG: hypothetical protein CVV47_12150 [Spirochaetae bacterium HGW-Spirochaetae-3]|nr:MAG: hypothetical protein CVV47_12150 [Spirochaetae bacterium HGW-Spirochaetae-3]